MGAARAESGCRATARAIAGLYARGAATAPCVAVRRKRWGTALWRARPRPRGEGEGGGLRRRGVCLKIRSCFFCGFHAVLVPAPLGCGARTEAEESSKPIDILMDTPSSKPDRTGPRCIEQHRENGARCSAASWQCRHGATAVPLRHGVGVTAIPEAYTVHQCRSEGLDCSTPPLLRLC